MMIMATSLVGIIFAVSLNIYDNQNRQILNSVVEMEDDVFTQSSDHSEEDVDTQKRGSLTIEEEPRRVNDKQFSGSKIANNTDY